MKRVRQGHLSYLYRMRRWLARRLVPKNLTVWCFDGIDKIGGSNAYDPELNEGWLAVKLQFWDEDFRETLEDGTEVIHLHKRQS